MISACDHLWRTEDLVQLWFKEEEQEAWIWLSYDHLRQAEHRDQLWFKKWERETWPSQKRECAYRTNLIRQYFHSYSRPAGLFTSRDLHVVLLVSCERGIGAGRRLWSWRGGSLCSLYKSNPSPSFSVSTSEIDNGGERFCAALSLLDLSFDSLQFLLVSILFGFSDPALVFLSHESKQPADVSSHDSAIQEIGIKRTLYALFSQTPFFFPKCSSTVRGMITISSNI